MARANTASLMSLDEFAAILGIHPLHFNQVVVDGLAPASTCGQPFVQYTWQQADSISREEIAQAIDDAERQIEMHLGFRLKPTWEADSVPFNGINPNRAYAPHGYVTVGGQEIVHLEQAGAGVVYTDADSDTYFETATITVPVSATDSTEIHIYYPGHYGSPEWEIPIVSCTIAAGVATIVSRRERFVTEANLERLDARAVDGLVNANFLTTVDVYRRYNNAAVGVTYRWHNYITTCGCCSPTCAACTLATQDGCLIPEDGRLGVVKIMPATWDGTEHTAVTCFTQCSMPDYATLYYKAGLPLEYNHIRNEFRRAIAYFAAALLDRPLCACDHIDVLAKRMQTDLALAQASPQGSTSYRFSQLGKLLDNPLGTRQGAMYAWRFIQKYKLGEAVCGR